MRNLFGLKKGGFLLRSACLTRNLADIYVQNQVIYDFTLQLVRRPSATSCAYMNAALSCTKVNHLITNIFALSSTNEEAKGISMNYTEQKKDHLRLTKYHPAQPTLDLLLLQFGRQTRHFVMVQLLGLLPHRMGVTVLDLEHGRQEVSRKGVGCLSREERGEMVYGCGDVSIVERQAGERSYVQITLRGGLL